MLGDSVRRRQPGGGRGRGRGEAGEGGGSSGRLRRLFAGAGARKWRPLLIALPLAILVPFAIGYLLAVFVVFPPTEVSAAGITVPDMIGSSASDAQRMLASAGLGPLDAEQLPHPSAPAGQVIAQSPLPGQQLRSGASVRVALSSGPPRALVPDVLGFSATRAESLLRRAGFEVAVMTEQSPAAAGRVLRTEPEPGQERMLPAFVTLHVSAGPPEPVEPLPPDTLDFETGG
jgi:eukaryotic-like serine/threonine-protein kinase